MKLELLFMAVATALLAGCATQMKTASGGPEVTISAPPAQVRMAVANAIVNAGYTLTRSDDLTIEGRKDAGMFLTTLTATPADPSAFKIARANLIVTDSGVRVLLRCYLTSSGRDQGEITGAQKQAQALLDKIKAQCEAHPAT